MKPQLITCTLAAFCAIAMLSCNKESAIDRMGPDTEYTVLLEASIDASTKAVGIDESKVVCTWAVDETVDLVYNNAIISTLKVISVSGNKAQLSGKVIGAYDPDTERKMMLYYGGTSYDYSGQTGTAESAVFRAYLQAETFIKSKDGKTLTLESVTMLHQQAYMGLSFYIGDSPVKVQSVVIDAGGENIVKTHTFGESETTYGTENFTVTAPTGGQEVFFFALRDNYNTDSPHSYTLDIVTVSDSKHYTGSVEAPKLSDNGNYFTDSKVILVRLSPVITAPVVYSYIPYEVLPPVFSSIPYDGNPHNLITPAVVRPGATAYYCVSNTAPSLDDAGWSTSIPSKTDKGTYKIWYKISGGTDYESILPTLVGTVAII